jgi:hypothetical protein
VEGLVLDQSVSHHFQDLPTWDVYSKDLNIDFSSIESDFQVDPVINTKIVLWHGDITTIETDCIVNAANESCTIVTISNTFIFIKALVVVV